MRPSKAHRPKEGFRFVYCPYCSIVRKVPGESRSDRVKRQNHEKIIERMGHGQGHTKDAAKEEIKKEEKRWGKAEEMKKANRKLDDDLKIFDEMYKRKRDGMNNAKPRKKHVPIFSTKISDETKKRLEGGFDRL